LDETLLTRFDEGVFRTTLDQMYPWGGSTDCPACNFNNNKNKFHENKKANNRQIMQLMANNNKQQKDDYSGVGLFRGIIISVI
jgi:hypothetical protein